MMVILTKETALWSICNMCIVLNMWTTSLMSRQWTTHFQTWLRLSAHPSMTVNHALSMKPCNGHWMKEKSGTKLLRRRSRHWWRMALLNLCSYLQGKRLLGADGYSRSNAMPMDPLSDIKLDLLLRDLLRGQALITQKHLLPLPNGLLFVLFLPLLHVR